MYEYGVVPPVTVFEKVTLWPVSIDWDVGDIVIVGAGLTVITLFDEWADTPALSVTVS